MSTQTILISGGTGMVGKRLALSYAERGSTVWVLTRSEGYRPGHPNIIACAWDGRAVPESVPQSDVVFNLAGAGIADRRWTTAYKHEVLHSRLNSTKACVEYINRCTHKPSVFVSMSAVGYYGSKHKQAVDEQAQPSSSDFLSLTCRQWEEAAQGAGVRTVITRMGIVLAPEGGAFPKLLTPFKYYAGAYLGNGKQGFPWIHIEDAIAALQFVAEHAEISGPVNIVSPDHQTNKSFAKLLGAAVNTSVMFGIPEFVVKTMMGERALVLLEGQHVLPSVLTRNGFGYKHPDGKEAIQHILANNPVQMKFKPGAIP